MPIPSLTISGWRFYLVLALVATALMVGYYAGVRSNAIATAHANQRAAQQTTEAVQSARAIEHKQANAFAGLDTKFLGDMRYAQALSAGTVAGLRDGSIRLSPTWRCPAQRAASVPAAAADTGPAETADRLRQESAGRIVGYVRQCQAERDYAVSLLEAERGGQ